MALVVFPPKDKTIMHGENHSAKEREENEYAGPTCKVQHTIAEIKIRPTIE